MTDYMCWVCTVLFLHFPGATDESVVKMAGLLAEMHAGKLKNMKQMTVTICRYSAWEFVMLYS
jgi:hypothetical protein